MATLLVIKAHPASDVISTSLTMGDRFIESYKESNPQDDVLVHDLYAEGNIAIDSSNLNVWKKLTDGTKYDELTPDEHILISRQQLLQEEFIKADKYVFINPMYNLFLPSKLKDYLDIVCQATKTWDYQKGGFLKDKIALHIQSSSGKYHSSDNPDMLKLDMGDHYLRMILGQIGVTDVQGIYCEGLNGQNPQADLQAKQAAYRQAEELGQQF